MPQLLVGERVDEVVLRHVVPLVAGAVPHHDDGGRRVGPLVAGQQRVGDEVPCRFVVQIHPLQVKENEVLVNQGALFGKTQNQRTGAGRSRRHTVVV